MVPISRCLRFEVDPDIAITNRCTPYSFDSAHTLTYCRFGDSSQSISSTALTISTSLRKSVLLSEQLKEPSSSSTTPSAPISIQKIC